MLRRISLSLLALFLLTVRQSCHLQHVVQQTDNRVIVRELAYPSSFKQTSTIS